MTQTTEEAPMATLDQNPDRAAWDALPPGHQLALAHIVGLPNEQVAVWPLGHDLAWEAWAITDDGAGQRPTHDWTATCEGDSADCVPSWEITARDYGYTVEMQCGWYEQHGEADSLRDLVTVCDTLHALNEAFQREYIHASDDHRNDPRWED